MDVTMPKPRWTSASFLYYAGGLTVLLSAIGSLNYLTGSYGDFAYVGWSLLVLGVLYVIAHAFRLRGRWIVAGVFAFAAVVAWAFFLYAVWKWFGWLDSDSFNRPFHGFSVARLSLALLVLGACFDDTRRFRFPFIAAITALVGWYFVTDLVSGGGEWTATVTLLVGLFYLAIGSATGRPTAFWIHLAGGLLVGGALLHWWHKTDTDWALISVAALIFVGIAYATRRSSWAVLGAIGLLLAGSHFAAEWSSAPDTVFGAPNPNDWVPYAVFAFVGFLLVFLGLRGRKAAAAPPPPPE